MNEDKNDKVNLELICSLRKDNPFYDEVILRHKNALLKGEFFYIDPKTGYRVFTSAYLKDRGYCCGNGCRHCPY
ncbi:MAG: hypothetical protein AUK34_06115 [Ignavibacteria bacterium CG2_30_36_16]|nr:hypothetical protein [Ignavibacteria bacterium]OIP60739.1 MAG: hypothetical protein AUK34_06115 [Ignavibacteria bacterium CG2_30_36_16]PJB00397.1 MAG: hypothetical protein CO127_08540 [Ignavibacteria bacterium CG_4_9_14_3_um_filter_36_18]